MTYSKDSTTQAEREVERLVDIALNARVPGGSNVWVWLPQKDAFTPSETARDVMRSAVEAVLSSLPHPNTAGEVKTGEREALIRLIASFPAHEADLGPDNEVFADVIPLDGAELGDCPKPIERLADAILALSPTSGGGAVDLAGATIPQLREALHVRMREQMEASGDLGGTAHAAPSSPEDIGGLE